MSGQPVRPHPGDGRGHPAGHRRPGDHRAPAARAPGASVRGGRWPLLSRAALGERYPDFALPPDFAFDPRWHDAPETEDGVLRRAGQVVLELWHTYAAPGAAIRRCAWWWFPRFPHRQAGPGGPSLAIAPGITAPRIDNASISTVEYSPPSRLLLGLNRVEHLEPLQVDWPAADPGYPRRP